ncbi:hypothetical protein D3C81_1636360 [compost metagenome]
MAILTNSGRAAVAAAVKAQALHMAWGSGDPAWDTTPITEPAEATALINEIGRRRATQVLFCTPNAQGELVVPTGRFTVSVEPTKYLYMRFSFDFVDAPASTIREVAVFVGTVPKGTVPPGQDYIVPSEVENPGQMLALEYIAKMERSADVRQQFEFVIQF